MSIGLFLIIFFSIIIILVNFVIIFMIYKMAIPSQNALMLSTTQEISQYLQKNNVFEKLHNELITLQFEATQVFTIQNKNTKVRSIVYKNIEKSIYCNVILMGDSKPYYYEFVLMKSPKDLFNLCVTDLPMKFLYCHREFHQIAYSSKYTVTQLYEAFLTRAKNTELWTLDQQLDMSELDIIKQICEMDIQAWIKQNIIVPNAINGFHPLTQHGKLQYLLKYFYPFNSLYIHKVSREAKTFFNLK